MMCLFQYASTGQENAKNRPYNFIWAVQLLFYFYIL